MLDKLSRNQKDTVFLCIKGINKFRKTMLNLKEISKEQLKKRSRWKKQYNNMSNKKNRLKILK